MSEFLSIAHSYNRLYNDFMTHSSICVGVDFDSTLYDTHKSGVDYTPVHNLIRDLKSIGCKIVVWTANAYHTAVEQFLTENNIPFDSINGDGIALGYDSRKPFFTALLDDRSGLLQVFNELSLLVKQVKQNQA